MTQNHRIVHNCINSWYKQNKPGNFNQTIWKSVLSRNFFLEGIFMLLKSGSEPLKSWNSDYAQLDCKLGQSFISCSVPRHFHTDVHKINDLTRALGPIPQLDGTEFRVHTPFELDLHYDAFRQRSWLQTGRTVILCHLKIKEVWCFTSQPLGREPLLLNQRELMGKSRELELEIHFLFQT